MIKVEQLSNGVTLVVEPMDHVHSAAIGVFVKIGSAYENIHNSGISHVVEHMLFKGTKIRSAKNIADQMARIGGDLNAYTAKEVTSYNGQVLGEHLYEAMDILADMLTNSLIDTNDLQKELGVILEEIDMYNDSAEDLVQELSQRESFRKHPLGYQISGEKEVVETFTRDAIIEFIQKYYVGSNIVVSIAGNLVMEEAISKAHKYFSQIPAGSHSVQVSKPEFYHGLSITHKESEQVHLCVAFEGVDYEHPGMYSLSLINEVIGGNSNSRLFQKIREDMGLVYSIYSYSASYKTTGIMQIYAGCNPAQLKTILMMISQCLRELRVNGMHETELAIAKEQMKSEILMGLESTHSRMSNNGKNLIYKGRLIDEESVISKLQAVSLDDIQMYIKDYLASASLTIVGNCNALDMKWLQKNWTNFFKLDGVQHDIMHESKAAL